jgi:hypothetical protein
MQPSIDIKPARSLIHALLGSASDTFLAFFLLVGTISEISGAISAAVKPFIQRSLQKSTDFPSPTSILARV